MSSPSSFFTLQTTSATLRRGRILIPSISSGGVTTPCLIVRTSRFLPPHLTPDNIDHILPADSSILEMNFDFILENETMWKSSPLSISELAGVSGKRATCMSTRVHSLSEKKNANIINGDDFVTVQNSSGSSKFELKNMKDILARFKPDFFIGAFDDHPIPVSVKRVRKGVDRSLKYEKFSQYSSESLNDLPFVSSISGAEYSGEKDRNISGISSKSSGIAFCDLHKLATFEERLELLKSSCAVPGKDDLLRIFRGSVTPMEISQLLPFVDVFDTSYVDEITSKGLALQLDDSCDVEPLNMWDETYFEDFKALSEKCSCSTCKNYKRSYVHHLLKSHEMLAGVLLTMHNLHQYHSYLESLKARE